MKNCENCNASISEMHNYCDWSCHIEQARKNGAQELLPNNLPIACVTDKYLLEHEHGDHKDYKFPIVIEYIGSDPECQFGTYCNGVMTPATTEDISYLKYETHALIYVDGVVAISMYEHCYAMSFITTGEVSGSLWKKKEWKLTEKSINTLKKYSSRSE